MTRRAFRNVEEVRAYQLDRLRSLLVMRTRLSPFIASVSGKSAFSQATCTPSKTSPAFRALTRQDVLTHLPDLWSRAFRGEDLLLMGTGGSTGVPMSYYKDIEDLDRCQTVLVRSHGWAGKGRWDLLAFFGSKHEPSGLVERSSGSSAR